MNLPNKMWDVFVSYASEDRDSVVRPLVEFLRRSGLRVWLDRQEIHVGESIREKIDEGLANSRFGIVILSESYFKKVWTKKELDGLLSIEEYGDVAIFPVWHQIDKSMVARYSPLLADRYALTTADGIENVAKEVIAEVLRRGIDSPSLRNRTISKEFINLLEGDADIPSIRGFLAKHSMILSLALGADCMFNPTGKRSLFPELERIEPYLCMGRYRATEECWFWNIISFELISEPLFTDDHVPTERIKGRLSHLDDCLSIMNSDKNISRRMRSLSDNQISVSTVPENQIIRYNVQGVLVTGRRKKLNLVEKNALREFNNTHRNIEIRTYDMLLDASLKIMNTAI